MFCSQEDENHNYPPYKRPPKLGKGRFAWLIRARHVTDTGLINNTTPDVAPTAPAYTDYTAISANVVAGSSFPITIGVNSSVGSSFNENQVLVWIDYNQDGDWDDVGEKIFDSVVLNGGPNSLIFTAV